MERRRAIGPKRTKNTPALVKAVILAAVIAILGSVLAYYLSELIGSPEQVLKADTDQKSSVSLIYHLPGILQVATVMAGLIVLFLGARTYMMGEKARHSILTGRKKLKRIK